MTFDEIDTAPLTFDEEKHEYFWKGVYVPNVTRILGGITDYSMIDPEKLAIAQAKGKAIHRAIELDCKGQLASIPDWMEGAWAKWQAFKEASGFEMLGSEVQFYNGHFGYAGTMDLVGRMPRAATGNDCVLIDVKRSFMAGPAIGLQLAAYQDWWNRAHADLKVRHRFALRVSDVATLQLAPYTDASDFSTFLSFLNVYKWKVKHYGR